MKTANNSDAYIVTVNAGSSSIKLAVFAVDDPAKRLFEATVADIGHTSASFTADRNTEPVEVKDHVAAATILWRWLADQISASQVVAVGHRIVHGGPKYHESQ